MARTRIIDEVFNEHIPLLGAPDIIVTRGWAWQFYEELGFTFKAGSFASVDYMAMRHDAVADLLTDLTEPWAANILKLMRAESTTTAR